MTKQSVGILVFTGVEVLDYMGPLEVFGLQDDFNIHIIGLDDIIETNIRNTNLTIKTDTILSNINQLYDIIIIPGGGYTSNRIGVKQAMKNELILNWINNHFINNKWILSICTGVYILAYSKILSGLTITTHHYALTDLIELGKENNFIVKDKIRFYDNNKNNKLKIITSAGISAGIDMSLYFISKYVINGEEKVKQTVKLMQYDYKQ